MRRREFLRRAFTLSAAGLLTPAAFDRALFEARAPVSWDLASGPDRSALWIQESTPIRVVGSVDIF